jgi:hypothetical protein
MTMPFATVGIGSGNCSFYSPSGVSLSASPSGTPATWTITSGATNIAGQFVVFRCLGAS